MLVNNEKRFQYIYFILSALVATMLVLLVYISVRLTDDDKQKNDLKLLQKTLIYQKPSTKWQYDNTWRYLGNTSYSQEVYSAYFDMRADIIANMDFESDEILVAYFRIFAVLPLHFKDKVQCITRFDDFTYKESSALDVQKINEDHMRGYSAYSILCPFSIKKAHQIIDLPHSIAVIMAKNQISRLSKTFVPISYPRQMDQIFKKSRPVLSVCVSPLNNNYSEVLRLVEFVEMYRILGASHFYFYLQSATEEVIRVLKYYQSLGLADVLEWNLQQDDIHYYGQLASLNDCVYRANIVDNYRYAAMVDLDEIMMPFKHNSLLDFLKQCDEGFNAAFVFRNVFFFKKDSNDTFSVPMHSRNRMLYTQIKMRRTIEIMPQYTRSKCIVNTKAIVEMGIHQKWAAISGYTDFVVHPSVGLLYHYRDKCINCKNLLIVDYSARRFGSLIWDRVDEICLQVFMDKRGICPIG